MYQLWQVRKINGRWKETMLHQRNYLNDVKSWAAKELGIEADGWSKEHSGDDSNLFYIDKQWSDSRHYTIEW